MQKVSVESIHSAILPPRSLWEVALDSEPVWLWRGRGEYDAWIARGQIADFASVLECRQVLDSIPLRDNESGVGPRCFGIIPFEPGDPNGIWSGFRGGFTLPRIIARIAASEMTVLDLAKTDHAHPNAGDSLFRSVVHRCAPKTSCLTRTVPARDQWRRSVETVRQAIRSAEVEKVVLARTVEVRADHPFDICSILHRLADDSPACDLFLHYRPRSGVFLGASPERLAEMSGEEILTESLAGSRPRGASRDQDRALALSLASSTKDRREHEIVTRFLIEQLRVFADRTQLAAEPEIRRFDSVQHLALQVRAVLQANHDADDVLAYLHPTPAVCGYPREIAREIIRKSEVHPRGLYAGVLGWLDCRHATFTVAIRSALIRENVAYVFAGAGIVADSDADSEWEETEWKMTPMLRALGVL